MLIGNDLVDLHHPEARGKSTCAGFVRRVFTPTEALLIREAADPDRMLWTLWAGKEAAYKVVRKLDPRAPFAHGAFEVRPGGRDADEAASGAGEGASHGESRLRGWARLPPRYTHARSLRLRWLRTASFVHCLALHPGKGTPHARVRVLIVRRDEAAGERRATEPDPEASDREARHARTVESRAVRALARTLARKAGVPTAEIVREEGPWGAAPPRVHRRGELHPVDGWDLSLSHHGRFDAAALSTSIRDPAAL